MHDSRTVVAVDVAKHIFQLHWVDTETGEIVRLKVRRGKLIEHFANLMPRVVAMEECAGAQHWARELMALGHEVKLLPTKAFRPFVVGNENDARDAHGIWPALTRVHLLDP